MRTPVWLYYEFEAVLDLLYRLDLLYENFQRLLEALWPPSLNEVINEYKFCKVLHRRLKPASNHAISMPL